MCLSSFVTWLWPFADMCAFSKRSFKNDVQLKSLHKMAVIVYIGLRMAPAQKKIFQKSSPMANRGTIEQSNVKNDIGTKNESSGTRTGDPIINNHTLCH